MFVGDVEMLHLWLFHICIFRAFWNYHSHYPSVGDKLFNSFDSQLQKHLKDEKRQLEGEPPPPPVQLSQVKYVQIPAKCSRK